MKQKKNIKFKIYTLGCKVNQYDSSLLSNYLKRKGFSFSEDDLDLVIINSCVVTKIALRKSRRLVNMAKKKYPQARIALIGCWPKAYNIDGLGISLISRERNIFKLSQEISFLFFKDKIEEDSEIFLNTLNDRSRYFIKIQDGCEQFCSYCIIPYTRGSLQSRPVDSILSEIKLAVKSGFEEIVLSGIHLGLYAHDFSSSKENLLSLLLKILKIKGLKRIRLSSIELNEVSDDLISLIKQSSKICSHLHIPLQSGSDRILKLMNRPYEKKVFLEKIKKIKKNIPDIALTTDVIVGFPSESEADFQESYKLLKSLSFSRIHVFSFSAHEKCQASAFPGKISFSEIKKRSEILRSLSEKLKKDYVARILREKKDLKLLVESFEGEKVRTKSEFYFDLYISRRELKEKFPAIDHLGLVGKIIDYRINS
jgi:threonylcarbamoyladenosine tRNA methylthiotransferase MtaB